MRGGGKRRGEVPVKAKPEEPPEVTNFIRNIIKQDLGSGKHESIVTRFPPEPSGHLHIGHVKACMLNAHFAAQYKGRMLLRFDDTNPSKEKEEYEEAIVKDLERLQITPAAVSHTSDWFGAIEKYAVQMIQEGLAYANPSPQEGSAQVSRQASALS